MNATQFDPFGARGTFAVGNKEVGIFRLSALSDQGIGHIEKLPFSIRVLLEAVLRNCDENIVNSEDVRALASW